MANRKDVLIKAPPGVLNLGGIEKGVMGDDGKYAPPTPDEIIQAQGRVLAEQHVEIEKLKTICNDLTSALMAFSMIERERTGDDPTILPARVLKTVKGRQIVIRQLVNGDLAITFSEGQDTEHRLTVMEAERNV